MSLSKLFIVLSVGLSFSLGVDALKQTRLMAQEEKLTSDEVKFFEIKIRPVLVKECYSCHSKSGNIKGGLLVDSKQGLLNGGSSGPAIEPGDLDESLLWNAINYEDYQMPPRNPLTDEEIADFRTWIEMGAPDPRVIEVTNVSSQVTQADIDRGRKFWSFVPLETSPVPAVDDSWPVSDIDRFVAARLTSAGMQPNDDADSLTVLRRLCFDLIGLPPKPDQIRSFEKRWKRSPDQAVERVVDELLQQPQFGERWGRHWLDIARYAESTGKEFNATYPHAWRYRDYVIDSFNADKPYDRFVAGTNCRRFATGKNRQTMAGEFDRDRLPCHRFQNSGRTKSSEVPYGLS